MDEAFDSPEMLKNLIKERVQEATVYGLARSGFFDAAAFCGGTSLRLFHGLNRFSEDLGFALMEPDPGFSFDKYAPGIIRALKSQGFEIEFRPCSKASESPIKTAHIVGSTRMLGTLIAPGSSALDHIVPSDLTKVKIEIDTNPPGHARYERLMGSTPYPYFANLYDMPTLFASKIAAILCRKWSNRVKGRDFYDYLFYIGRDVPANLEHLRSKLINVGCVEPGSALGEQEIARMLEDRIREVDFDLAREDVARMITDENETWFWSTELFLDATKKVRFC